MATEETSDLDFDEILKLYIEHSLNYADLVVSLRSYAEKKYADYDQIDDLASIIESTLTNDELSQAGADNLFVGVIYLLHALNELPSRDKHKKIIAKLLKKV